MTDVINPTGETPAAPASAAASDQPVNPQPQQPAEPTEEAFDKDRAMSTIRNLREQEKAWKKERAELEALKAEKAKREEAEMSETDRLRKQATEAAAQVAQLQAEIWKSKAASEAGIPSILADRLTGSSYEEVLADAKKLAEALPKKTAPGLPPTNPGGAVQGETPAQIRQRIFGANADPFAGGGVVWPDKPLVQNPGQ